MAMIKATMPLGALVGSDSNRLPPQHRRPVFAGLALQRATMASSQAAPNAPKNGTYASLPLAWSAPLAPDR
jgi:hypothetical protein